MIAARGCSRRALVRSRAVQADRPVFLTRHGAAVNANLGLDEIEVLMRLGERMKERSREELFYAHGVDYVRVCEYYETVKSLEKSYEKNRRRADYAAVAWYANRLAALLCLWLSGRL